MKNKRLYNIYNGMKQRCNDSNHISYKYYGAKGIIVEWNTFKEFESWALSNGYTNDLEIDRINSNLNYCPSNCRWTTRQIQNRNATIRTTNKTGVKGCYYEKRASKYRQQIKVDGKNISLGYFETIDECKAAREKYIKDNNITQ